MIGLFRQFLPLIVPGLGLAVWRLFSEFWLADSPDVTMLTMSVSVYYAMAGAWVALGFTSWFDGVRTRRMLAGVLLVSFCVWFVPNAVGYTVAQFQEWNFGRYAYDAEWYEMERSLASETDDPVALRALVEERLGREPEQGRGLPPADGAVGKVMSGLLTALLTMVAATLWNGMFMGLGVLMPRRRRTSGGSASSQAA